MKPILYLEGACGISGDMTVAALLDLGASKEKLEAVIASLNLDGFHYHISTKKSYGIAGCDFDVHLHEHEHHHEHHHEHEHHHQEHHHEHRNLADVYAIIERGAMSEWARAKAKEIFLIVAEAEAKAHGCALEEVHFHEVGAIDSIVDIVAAAVLLDDLGVEQCIVPHLCEGSGFVNCQHGQLPVPVPAVLNIAQATGIALKRTETRGEMVTPTGIAIAAAIRTSSTLPEAFTVKKIGVGLGKRDFGHANILRAMFIEPVETPESIYVVETNIDDSTGETLSYAMEELFKAGARDVHFTPCFMKKNRPAYLLRAIVDKAIIPAIENTIFSCTTAIGLRKYPVQRTIMERETVQVQLPQGVVQVKRCRYGEIVRNYPEYESVKQVAQAAGSSFMAIYEAAQQLAEKMQ